MIPILFLCFNRLDFTKQSLDAIEKHTKGYKLYIVDNGSNDGTREYLMERKFKGNFEIWFTSENSGVDRPMNWFYEVTEGQYLAKVDNDTIVPPGWLDKLKEDIEGLDIVGASHHTMSKSALYNMKRAADTGKPFLCSCVGGSGILYRRDIHDRCGLIDTDYDNAGILDCWSNFITRHSSAGNLKIAMSPLWVDLLDMDDHFKRRSVYGEYDTAIAEARTKGFDEAKEIIRGRLNACKNEI